MEVWRNGWQSLRWLWSHPLVESDRLGALVRVARWQLGARLLPGTHCLPFVNSTVLLASRGMAGATGNVYAGLHEFAEMGFLLHYLRPGDWFIDVGANIGSYTILAAGARGARALAVEPLPAAFAALMANVRINALEDRVRALNVGVAGRKGTLRFTRGNDTMNHVLAENEGEGDALDVHVLTLDDVVGDRSPALVKVDVEGFETEVFAGGGRTLAAPSLQALILELNGSGNRYGFDEGELRRHIEAQGFQGCAYDPRTRCLMRASTTSREGNALFVRESGAVAERLRDAPPFRVAGMEI